jgi:outer membrane protein assembly factor BamE (lipoprotein component of BamABCDE complex)
MRTHRFGIAALAFLMLPACVTSEMLYADRYSYERVQAIKPGATLDEVMAQLGAYTFKTGRKYTWIQNRHQEGGLRVTEVSMYFDANGIMTGHADYDRQGY